MNRYLIGTGYFHKPEDKQKAQEFFDLWLRNTFTHDSNPNQVVVLGNGGCRPNIQNQQIQVLSFEANLGHVHCYIGIEEPAKDGNFCGWSISIVTLAMLAYWAELDFVFKESDCLTFGDCIGQMYREIGTRGCIFGKLKVMPVAQSLFLVKREFIPEFCRLYLGTGSERNRTNLPEHKFERMLKMMPHLFCQFSFPFDRDRPLNYELPVWYAQKFTTDEMVELRNRGMV